MTQKEKIEKDYIVAFKAKDTVAKNLLSVIKGEIQSAEKAPGFQGTMSDEDVNKILYKTIKNLKETIDQSGDDESKSQLLIVESYLPKQMSKEEVVKKVTELVSSGITNIGGIMKEFATLPADKKMVSEAIKEVVK